MRKKKARKELIDKISIGQFIVINILDLEAQKAVTAAVDACDIDNYTRGADGVRFPYHMYDEHRDDFSKCPGFHDVPDRHSFENRLFEQLTGVRLPAILNGAASWGNESAVMSVIDCKLVERRFGCVFVLRGYNLYSDGRFCKDSRSMEWGEPFLFDRSRRLDGTWSEIPLLTDMESVDGRYRFLYWLPGGKVAAHVYSDKAVCEVQL